MRRNTLSVKEQIFSLLKQDINRYWTKKEIASALGLKYNTVNLYIKEAFALGWVERKQIPRPNVSLRGHFDTYSTSYRITKTDSWLGLSRTYRKLLQKRKWNEEN